MSKNEIIMSGRLLEKWMKENNIKTGSGYEMGNCFHMKGKEEEINYSDILLKKRFKCKPFGLSYFVFDDNRYSFWKGDPYKEENKLSETDFLRHVKREFRDYNSWYIKESYPPVKEKIKEKHNSQNTQTKLF